MPRCTIASEDFIWFPGRENRIAAVGMLILQAYVMIKTYTNSVIHDLISDTAVVDYASQQIFESEEELTEFLQRTAAEATAKNA